MKIFKSLLITFLCAIGILIIGYAGIIFYGNRVLKSSSEPEVITMTGDISGLFYSRMEDDIRLYPWNYYPKNVVKEDLGMTNSGVDSYEGPFTEYSLYLENDVFYTLIALMANVEPQEVSHWYNEQGKTIMMNMVQGQREDALVDLFFYDDTIRLNGKEYRVKISCNQSGILSFSCIQKRGETIRETEEWRKQKEKFVKWTQKNPGWLGGIYGYMQEMCRDYEENQYAPEDWEAWYRYVQLYQSCLQEIQDYKEDLPIQIIELGDSLLLVMEADITMGIYYDVLEQKAVGFHFFQD